MKLQRKNKNVRKVSKTQKWGDEVLLSYFKREIENVFGIEFWNMLLTRHFAFRDIEVPGLSTPENPVTCSVQWPVAYLIYLMYYPRRAIALHCAGVGTDFLTTTFRSFPELKEAEKVAAEIGRGRLEKFAFDVAEQRHGVGILSQVLKANIPEYKDSKDLTVKGDKDNPLHIDGMIVMPEEIADEEDWNDQADDLLKS